MKYLHPKIQALKNNALPYTRSTTHMKVEKRMVIRDDGALAEENVVKGYLNVWGVVDSYGTMFIKGAFAKSISERGPESNSKQKIAFIYHHHMDDPIGQFRVLKEDDYGLYFEAVLDDFDAVPSAKRVAAQIKSGTINQFSIGFDYIWDKMEYDDKLDCIILKEVDLYEGSPVTLGSNAETYVVRSAEDYSRAKNAIDEETDVILSSLPVSKRAEIRDLIARHVTLSRCIPKKGETTQPGGSDNKRSESIDYDYLTSNFKL